MFVKHLQEYLDKFTEGPQGRRGNAVSNARIYIATPNGYLEEIRRIEVQRREIFDLKKYVSEDIKNKNLLQGYRKVIEDISSQVRK